MGIAWAIFWQAVGIMWAYAWAALPFWACWNYISFLPPITYLEAYVMLLGLHCARPLARTQS